MTDGGPGGDHVPDEGQHCAERQQRVAGGEQHGDGRGGNRKRRQRKPSSERDRNACDQHEDDVGRLVMESTKARVTEIDDSCQEAKESGHPVQGDPPALGQAVGEPACSGPSLRVNGSHGTRP